MLDLPIRKIQSDFTSIYAQILGCVIMGFVTRHKRYFTSDAPRLRKVLYLGLTSGLCGSITTFATWNVQCNQACFLDSTVMPGSYIPARVLAWLMCLSTCVALSLKSLHFGHFLATFSPNSDDNRPADAPAPPADACGPSSEPSLAAAYAVATAAAVLVPALRDSRSSPPPRASARAAPSSATSSPSSTRSGRASPSAPSPPTSPAPGPSPPSTPSAKARSAPRCRRRRPPP